MERYCLKETDMSTWCLCFLGFQPFTIIIFFTNFLSLIYNTLRIYCILELSVRFGKYKYKSHKQTNLTLTLLLACGQESWWCELFSSHHSKSEFKNRYDFRKSEKYCFKHMCPKYYNITDMARLHLRGWHDMIWSTVCCNKYCSDHQHHHQGDYWTENR